MANALQDLMQRMFARPEIIEPGNTTGDAAQFSPMASYYRSRMELSSSRVKQYKDYRDMGEDTLISGALDIYADEACQVSPTRHKTVWVTAANPQITAELTRMLDRIDIEDYIFGLSRYLSQYGDNFIRPLANRERGIVGIEFMEAEDVERLVDKYSRLTGFRVAPFGNQVFAPWDMVHFRVLSRTQTVRQGGSVYGTSVLENARRTWRQLCLSAESQVWTTDGPKLIKDIFDGDVVYCHDPETGETKGTEVVGIVPMGTQPMVRVWTKHRHIDCTPNHGLLAKGSDGTFSYKMASQLLSSKIDGEVADSLVLPILTSVWASCVIEGACGTLPVTTDVARIFGFLSQRGHLGMLGSKHRLEFSLSENATDEYYEGLFFLIFNTAPDTNTFLPGGPTDYVSTCKQVTSLCIKSGLFDGDKTLPPWVFNLSPALKLSFLIGMSEASCNNPRSPTFEFDDLQLANDTMALCQQAGIDCSPEITTVYEERDKIGYSFRANFLSADEKNKVTYERVVWIEDILKEETYDLQVQDDLHNFVVNGIVSHNTLLEDVLVIYRLEIAGRHRVFYIDVGGVSHEQALALTRKYQRFFGKKQYYSPESGEWSSRYNPLNLTADIFWPIRKDSNSRIDYLGVDPNVTGVADIEYFRDKLFAALKIPKAYIGLDAYSSVKYGLAQIDITFGRSIRRLQRSLIGGLTRLCQIHLALIGVDPIKPENQFRVEMMSPSTLDEQQRLEVVDMSLNLAQKMQQMGEMLGADPEVMRSYLLRNILSTASIDIEAMINPQAEVPSDRPLADSSIPYGDLFSDEALGTIVEKLFSSEHASIDMQSLQEQVLDRKVSEEDHKPRMGELSEKDFEAMRPHLKSKV